MTEFETRAQQDVYQKIEPWLKDLFGIFFQKRADAPYFGVTIGSTLAHVGVQPWGAENASITVRAYVAMDVELHPDLLLFLLRENDRMRFGAFGLDEDNDLFFEYSLPGLTCSAQELRNSIVAVGQAAGQLEDHIISRWGGIPASELQTDS